MRANDLIASLRERNARLHNEARELKAERTELASRVETLEATLAELRASRAVLSKALFGSRSEQQEKPPSGRPRGQQPGAAGHGRTERPAIEERTETGARFTALMYSVVGTLATNGINVRHWLEAWLRACADNGGRAPQDLSPWLPWPMNEERKRALIAPG